MLLIWHKWQYGISFVKDNLHLLKQLLLHRISPGFPQYLATKSKKKLSVMQPVCLLSKGPFVKGTEKCKKNVHNVVDHAFFTRENSQL